MVMLDSEVATGRSPLLSLRRRYLPLIHLASDLAVWMVAIVAGTWIRYEFRLDLVARRDLAEVVLFALVAHVAVGGLVGLYRRRWRYGSFEEAVSSADSSRLRPCRLDPGDRRWHLDSIRVPPRPGRSA